MTAYRSVVMARTRLPVLCLASSVPETVTPVSHRLEATKTVRLVRLEHSPINQLHLVAIVAAPSVRPACTRIQDSLLALNVPRTSSSLSMARLRVSSVLQICIRTDLVQLFARSASLSNAPIACVSTAVSACQWDTVYIAIVRLASLEDVARLISMSAHLNRATTVPLV